MPISYGRVSIWGSLPPTCYAYIRSKTGASIENPIATFDVTILDRDGNAIIEISDFSVRQIREMSLLDSAIPALGADLSNHEGVERIRDRQSVQPSDAISSEEGAKAFERVLANPRVSRVVVFPSDFSAYLDRLQPLRTNLVSDRLIAVPAGNSNDDVEITLTRWWKELLGVESVNGQESFFDLGGNSLTGVRMLAKVKKTYGVDLKLATLFTASTIEKLCALVCQQSPAPSFSSLIPIQPSGTKPPLYLIHGIGGSAFSFRELIKVFSL